MSASGSITVTKLQRADHGELEARITLPGGETVPVSRRFGSWGVFAGDSGWREVLPRYAAELQERARPYERAEREAAARAAALEFLSARTSASRQQVEQAGIGRRALDALIESGEVTRQDGRYRIAQLAAAV